MLVLGKVARSVVTLTAVSGSEMKERWHSTYMYTVLYSETMQTDIVYFKCEQPVVR